MCKCVSVCKCVCVNVCVVCMQCVCLYGDMAICMMTCDDNEIFHTWMALEDKFLYANIVFGSVNAKYIRNPITVNAIASMI